jgi:hypothetical protein
MSVLKTLGEIKVGTSFNPSDNSIVQHIKERAAEMINYVYENVPDNTGEQTTLKNKAIDAIELAAMYAVKAATA